MKDLNRKFPEEERFKKIYQFLFFPFQRNLKKGEFYLNGKFRNK